MRVRKQREESENEKGEVEKESTKETSRRE